MNMDRYWQERLRGANPSEFHCLWDCGEFAYYNGERWVIQQRDGNRTVERNLPYDLRALEHDGT